MCHEIRANETLSQTMRVNISLSHPGVNRYGNEFGNFRQEMLRIFQTSLLVKLYGSQGLVFHS